MPDTDPSAPDSAGSSPMSTETISTSPSATPPSATSPITTEQVAHLASLARIALTTEEIEKLAGELGTIVDSIAKVSEVAGADVVATSHPIPLVNVYRADVPGATLTPDEALAGAPERDGDRFKVSAILGEEQ